jgi:hypothetical protein
MNARLLFLARTGPERVACQCLLLGVEQTCRAGGQTSEFDPAPTWTPSLRTTGFHPSKPSKARGTWGHLKICNCEPLLCRAGRDP